MAKSAYFFKVSQSCPSSGYHAMPPERLMCKRCRWAAAPRSAPWHRSRCSIFSALRPGCGSRGTAQGTHAPEGGRRPYRRGYYPAGTDQCGGCTGRAPVVAVGIVDVLEVIQIHHHQRRHAHALRRGKQLGAHPVEGLPVVQPGQDIVIALVLDALPFQHGGGHVLGKADLVSSMVLRSMMAPPIRLLNGQQLVALGGVVRGFFPGCP